MAQGCCGQLGRRLHAVLHPIKMSQGDLAVSPMSHVRINAFSMPILPLLIAVASAPAAAVTRNQCYDRYAVCSATCAKSPAPSPA